MEIRDTLIRLSVGQENPDDLYADLVQAMQYQVLFDEPQRSVTPGQLQRHRGRP